MALKLHLGVVDAPYSTKGSTTTGDVAEILESRYGIMETFYRTNEDEIVAALEAAMQGKLETLLLGGPVDTAELFSDGDFGPIEQAFRKFLDTEGMRGRAAGVPTAAAQAGVNHRLLHPYAKSNPPRPSFIDTGSYQTSMRAWIEENK